MRSRPTPKHQSRSSKRLPASRSSSDGLSARLASEGKPELTAGRKSEERPGLGETDPDGESAGGRAGPSVSGRLDDQLCFALYAATNAMQRMYAPYLRALGLTYLQYLVLLVLWENDARTVGDIGLCLFLDSGTLTPVLRRLENLELVTRTRVPEDERSVRIELTERGTLMEAKLDVVRSHIACQTALPPTEFTQLRRQLRTLHLKLTTEA